MNLFCIIYNVCSYFVSLFLLLSFVSPFFHYHFRFTIYKVHKASKKKREKSSAKKERKATKTLAIVLGEYNNDCFCYNHELIIFIFISSYCFFQMFFFIACTQQQKNFSFILHILISAKKARVPVHFHFLCKNKTKSEKYALTVSYWQMGMNMCVPNFRQ